MVLTIDIGNSEIKGGIFSSGRLENVFRIIEPREGVEDSYRRQMQQVLEDLQIQRVGIASVVPTLTTMMASIIEEITDVRAEILHVGPPAPVKMKYETPDTLGIDRLAGAVAGFIEFGYDPNGSRPIIVIDAGTAITYEVVDATGTYLGGMISPGPSLLQDSLVQKTAQLSSVPLELPEDPIGRSTAEAIQSGVMSTCIDGIRGAIQRLSAAIEGNPLVVMTGGWAQVLAVHLSEIDHHDPHLVLRGIYLLMQHGDEERRP